MVDLYLTYFACHFEVIKLCYESDMCLGLAGVKSPVFSVPCITINGPAKLSKKKKIK